MKPRYAHPSVFMFLITPFGAMSGYLSVAVAFLLAKNGITVEEIAALVALSVVPHTWKFAWAPIVDTTLTRKAWYAIGSVLSAVGIFAVGALPPTHASLRLLSTTVLVSNVGATFLAMSVEGLMAYGTADSEKGRASGWFQAGNLGGAGLGGGLGLWLAQHTHAAVLPGAIIGGLCLLCGIALWFVAEPAPEHREGSLAQGLALVAKDLWSVARSRTGFLALVLCFVPIGSGAAGGLWSAVADDWSASANTVALVTGVLGGIVSAVGCIAGGWLCDRMDRKTAYAAYGVLQAVCAVAMALAPGTETVYVGFTLAYAFITGLTYAGFSSVVLETIGMGAAATKYSVFASLSNTPIWYMTMVDGWAHTRWGPAGMLLTEAACCLMGLVVFLGVVAIMPRRTPEPVP